MPHKSGYDWDCCRDGLLEAFLTAISLYLRGDRLLIRNTKLVNFLGRDLQFEDSRRNPFVILPRTDWTLLREGPVLDTDRPDFCYKLQVIAINFSGVVKQHKDPQRLSKRWNWWIVNMWQKMFNQRWHISAAVRSFGHCGESGHAICSQLCSEAWWGLGIIDFDLSRVKQTGSWIKGRNELITQGFFYYRSCACALTGRVNLTGLM